MTKRFGPTRGELKFRLAFSLAGLALMIVALFYRGVPTGPAFVEVVGIAGLFFGGTAIWTARQLLRRREDE
jgi:xanthosine utilization system XapX-like protein